MIDLNNFNTVKLVEGNISHTRHVKPFNSFNYKCISIIVNLNKTINQEKIGPLFSINKSNIFSWYSKDHGDGEIHPLEWARKEVSNFGGDASGTILLHCFPKIFGYVFNPLSIYFCFNKNNKVCPQTSLVLLSITSMSILAQETPRFGTATLDAVQFSSSLCKQL